MNLIGNLLSDLGVSTIGWTLIHSLWQGTVLALVFALLMVLLKRSRPAIRYLTGVAVLCLMLVTTVVTAGLVYQAETARVTAGTAFAGGTTGSALEAGGDFWLRVKVAFDHSLPLIVSIWFLGALFFFLKFVSGILVNQRLRHHHTREVSDYWKARMGQLARKVRVRCRVVMRESFIARIPMVIGHLKPVILFPVGMLAQIPPGQVETLIVHELAHILRRDYLVNVFQNCMDILYFYHPGIRWISSQIRSEREHCCDDLTVAALQDRMTYARALTRVGEKALGAGGDLAVAASGNSLKLFKRIRRLYPMNNQRSKFVDGLVSFAVMALFAVTLLAGLNASGILFARGDQAPAVSETRVEKDENKKEAVEKLEHRYQELYNRKSELNEEEKKELEEIARQLKTIQKEEEQKKIIYVKTELQKLGKKEKLTGEEKEKYEKYTRYLKQYEYELKLKALKSDYKKLKMKEGELTEEEQKKLQVMEKKLKAVELEKKEKQKAMNARALKTYQSLKAREAELIEEEQRKLQEATLLLRKMKEEQMKEQQARQKELQSLKEEYRKLIELEERSQEQEKQLKKMESYLKQMKARYKELKEKEQILEKKIQELESKKDLTEEEQKELQMLKMKYKDIKTELSIY